MSFPGPSLHLGGALGGGLGPLPSDPELALRIEGAIEVHIFDVVGWGLVVGSQGLPDVLDRGERATTVSSRIRMRYPLVREWSSTVVPLLTLAVEGGGGWISDPRPEDDAGLGIFGASVGLDMVVLGRVTPFVTLGYRHHLMSGPDLRQLEAHVGLSVRLVGGTKLGPRPSPEPRRELNSRREAGGEETGGEELCERAPPGSFRARLCAGLNDEDDDDDE